MHSLIRPIITQFETNTELFLKNMKGLSNETITMQPKKGVNSIGFLAVHLHDARYYIGQYIGLAVRNPFADMLRNVENVVELTELPEITEIISTWKVISEKLIKVFEQLDEDKLLQKAAVDLPINDDTLIGSIAFFMQHESYHIGQITLLRKLLGMTPAAF